jgi:predicted transcriptional regulator
MPKLDPYVVARFFDRLQRSEMGRLKPTRLQVATGLNWSVFTKYLEALLELELLEADNEGKETFIRTTEKGRTFYHTLLEALDQLLGTEDA